MRRSRGQSSGAAAARTARQVFVGLIALFCAGGAAAQEAYDPAPWIADLQQVREVVTAHYANLEWAVKDRGVDLPAAYARAETGLGKAGGEAEARRLMSAFLSGFGDGHLRVEWPTTQPVGAPAPTTPSAPARPGNAESLCGELGFSSWGEDTRAVARRLPGYEPLRETPAAKYFPAGTIRREGRTIGVLRIHLFMPQSRPDLCREVLAAAPEPNDGPCDVFCRNRLMARIEAHYSDALAQQLDALNKAGADVLLLDLAGNGGGSDWVGAAARMISPKPLRAQPLGLIRHPDFARSQGASGAAEDLRRRCPGRR
jgi:hypothetical protein